MTVFVHLIVERPECPASCLTYEVTDAGLDDMIADVERLAKHPLNAGVTFVLTEDVFYGTTADRHVKPMWKVTAA